MSTARFKLVDTVNNKEIDLDETDRDWVVDAIDAACTSYGRAAQSSEMETDPEFKMHVESFLQYGESVVEKILDLLVDDIEGQNMPAADSMLN